MALVLQASSALPAASTRKRTSSFSFAPTSSPFTPRPVKAPRLSHRSMRRTQSFLDMSDAAIVPSNRHSSSSSSSSQLTQHSCAQERPRDRERHKTPRLDQVATTSRVTTSDDAQMSASPPPATPSMSTLPEEPSSEPSGSAATVRTTSPLAPTRTCPLTRPTFPRSKAKLDLHKKAVTTCMLRTPEGQRILHMGPRLALSIATATKELEKIVAATMDRDSDNDVIMGDSCAGAAPTGSASGLSQSWVFVPGEDWEMISCN